MENNSVNSLLRGNNRSNRSNRGSRVVVVTTKVSLADYANSARGKAVLAKASKPMQQLATLKIGEVLVSGNLNVAPAADEKVRDLFTVSYNEMLKNTKPVVNGEVDKKSKAYYTKGVLTPAICQSAGFHQYHSFQGTLPTYGTVFFASVREHSFEAYFTAVKDKKEREVQSLKEAIQKANSDIKDVNNAFLEYMVKQLEVAGIDLETLRANPLSYQEEAAMVAQFISENADKLQITCNLTADEYSTRQQFRISFNKHKEETVTGDVNSLFLF